MTQTLEPGAPNPYLAGNYAPVPDEITIERSTLDGLATGRVSGELADLVRRKIIVDLPNRYY